MTAIKNIFREWYGEIGKWAYLLIILGVPIYYFAKLFNIHNKNYERKD